MADDEKMDSNSSQGADWEVVALTASTYAVATEANAVSLYDSRDNEFQREQESSNAMFMSEHFVFPPHEHENLPVEEVRGEIHDQIRGHDILPMEKEVNHFDEFNKDDSDTELSILNIESQEEQTHYISHTETVSDDKNDIAENYDSSNEHFDMPSDFINLIHTSDGKNVESDRPSETWWKRHAISLYNHAKETNTFWSIIMAAALMGLVVLGQQWQREKLQLQQLKWQFSFTNERMSRIFGSVNRFKYALVGGHQHSSLVHGGAAAAAAAANL